MYSTHNNSLLLSLAIYTQRSSQPVDGTSTEMAVSRNISYYITAPSHPTSVTQATRAASESETGGAAEYSRIGPSYETIVNSNHSRRQQPVAERNHVSARLSERYEFSEAHLAVARGSGGVQGEVAMDYEVPLNSSEHEECSHLQH